MGRTKRSWEAEREWDEQQQNERRRVVKRPEQELQKMCVKWMRYQHPTILFFHPANGGYRTAMEAKIFKGLGVSAGVPDLVVCKPSFLHHALFIELKAGKGKLSENQKEWIEKLRNENYMAEVVSSFEEFQKIVTIYLDHAGR